MQDSGEGASGGVTMRGSGPGGSGAQVLYFSHGGGPLPLLGDPGHRAMVAFMRKLPQSLRRPKSILVVSAHWEEPLVTLQGSRAPGLFYDYYGFPDEAYEIGYPAPGNPELAAKLAGFLDRAGIRAEVEDRRGFDHGLFIPLKLMYPEAEIPALQMSLRRGLDPAEHYAIGEALRPLLAEDVLVIGSGFSFHNMSKFAFGAPDRRDLDNDAFQDWLIETCAGGLSQEATEARLLAWEDAPSARYCHPREEHLLPLHVCAGLAGRNAECVFDDYILGKRAVAFRW